VLLPPIATICADAGQSKAKKKNVAMCKAHAIFENVMPIPQIKYKNWEG
jgi:hypothetical protein